MLDDQHVKSVCKMGQGAACCRYLIMSVGGFECAKLTALKAHLDARVAKEDMRARGDNCPGKPMERSA
jgi:hypothetical protein